MDTLTSKFTAVTKEFSGRVAVVAKHDGVWQKYSFQQLYDLSQNIAHKLKAEGFVKGDKIAILLENCWQWPAIYFAIMYLGGIAIPIDPQVKKLDLRFFLAHSEAKAIFSSDSFALLLQDLEIKVLLVGDFNFNEAPPFHFENVGNEGDLASILYTSGTTGTPKGVMLSHQNFYANFCSIEQSRLLTSEHNILGILPLHHSLPFMVNLLLPIFTGNTVTYLDNLQRDEILKCMQEFGVTVLVGVPQFFNLFQQKISEQFKSQMFLVRLFLSLFLTMAESIKKLTGVNLQKFLLAKLHHQFGVKLQFFASGGAKLDLKVAKFLTRLGFTVLEGYGLTETSPVVSFNTPTALKIGSVGKVIPGVQVKIVDPGTDGSGEVVIAGLNVMQGYYKWPEATNEAIKDGWFYTGDLGYLDDNGFLYITGRKKELIILSNGKNMSPEEVENYYGQSPFIKELCVFASFEKLSERLVAVIVPDLDYFRKMAISNVHDMLKWDLDRLSKNYPPYKRVLGFILVTEELPRTRLGKLKRYLISNHYLPRFQLLEKPMLPEARIIPSDELLIFATPIGRGVLKVINNITGSSQAISAKDHFELDLGMDSLKRLELYAAIEKEFQVTISELAKGRIFTVNELILEIHKASTSSGKAAEIAFDFSWHEIVNKDPDFKNVPTIELSSTKTIKFLGRCLDGFIKAAFKVFWRLQVVGGKNLLNAEQPFIICANHASYLDGFVIAASLPFALREKVFFVGGREHFIVPVIRKLIKFLKVIPINPSIQLADALQTAGFILRHQHAICIFPEGARSIDGEIQIFKKGVGILVKELKVKVIPAYITGSFEAWPRGQKYPKFHKIKVYYGEPCSLDELMLVGKKTSQDEDEYEVVAEGIRNKISEIKKRVQN